MTTLPGTDASGYPNRGFGGNTRPLSLTTTDGQPPASNDRAIYLPAEMASYLRAASPRGGWRPAAAQIHSWIRRGLLAPAFRAASADEVVVDFEDLVTGQAIALLRAT